MLKKKIGTHSHKLLKDRKHVLDHFKTPQGPLRNIQERFF